MTSRRYDLGRRTKLFTSVVQPTLLYGGSSWTTTRAREHLLRTTQRKMMRTIIGCRRLVVNEEMEDWIQWMQRATRKAEEVMEEHGVPDRVSEVHRRKFEWAGHIARRHDGRWTREILMFSAKGSRSRKRPLTRWTDSLHKFFSSMYGASPAEDNLPWMALAEDRDLWKMLQPDYVNFIAGQA